MAKETKATTTTTTTTTAPAPAPAPANPGVTLRLDTSNPERQGNGAVYRFADGRRGLVYFPANVFADGKIPGELTVSGFVLAPAPVPAAKLTPEERKVAAAARKAELEKLSPAERAKLAAEKAAEVAAKAAKRAAQLATAAAAADAAVAKAEAERLATAAK